MLFNGHRVHMLPVSNYLDSVRCESEDRSIERSTYSKTHHKKTRKQKKPDETVKAGNLPGNRGEEPIENLMEFIGGGKKSVKITKQQEKISKSRKKSTNNSQSENTEEKSSEFSEDRKDSLSEGSSNNDTVYSDVTESLKATNVSQKVNQLEKFTNEKLTNYSDAESDHKEFEFVMVSNRKKNTATKKYKELTNNVITRDHFKSKVTIAGVLSSNNSHSVKPDNDYNYSVSFPVITKENRCSSTGDVSIQASHDESDRESVVSVPNGVGSGISQNSVTYASITSSKNGKSAESSPCVSVAVLNDTKSAFSTEFRSNDCSSNDNISEGKERTCVHKHALSERASDMMPNVKSEMSAVNIASTDQSACLASPNCNENIVCPQDSCAQFVNNKILPNKQQQLVRRNFPKLKGNSNLSPSVVFLDNFDHSSTNTLGIKFGFDGYDDIEPSSSVKLNSLTEQDVSNEFAKKACMNDSGTGSVDGSDTADDANAQIGFTLASPSYFENKIVNNVVLRRKPVTDTSLVDSSYNYVRTVAYLLKGV